jgi:hypothetical protein
MSPLTLQTIDIPWKGYPVKHGRIMPRLVTVMLSHCVTLQLHIAHTPHTHTTSIPHGWFSATDSRLIVQSVDWKRQGVSTASIGRHIHQWQEGAGPLFCYGAYVCTARLQM